MNSHSCSGWANVGCILFIFSVNVRSGWSADATVDGVGKPENIRMQLTCKHLSENVKMFNTTTYLDD